MSRYLVARAPKRRFSLSIYISLLLIGVAIIPLLVTIGGIEAFLRPSLVSQISADMERDAQTHVQLIDTYLAERLNDVETLSESDSIKNMLAGDHNSNAAASNTLFTALHRDIADYISISLLDTHDNVVLSYPTAPAFHGKYLILPGLTQQINATQKVIVSDVFFDPLANNPSVDLYSRVVDNNLHPIGIIRASLSLHRLWQPVDATPQQEGVGSYAFVLDQHGVRIAYTNPDHSGFQHPQYLFQAIAQLPQAFQQQIKDENLYGNATRPVATSADDKLTSIQNNAQSPLIFSFDPVDRGQTFEAARYTSTVVPWTYYVLKPLSTVTGLADQQLLSVFIVVTVMLLLSLIIGLQVGGRITGPITRSVTSLRKNSLSLKTLAGEEQVVATEQSWMVEASQVALQSIRYYTNAASIAAQRLTNLSVELTRHPNNIQDFRLNQSLKEIAEAAKYVDLAVKHQESANEKLAAALRVTTRAMEQLTTGAKSTDEAAVQLESIVRQLTDVVGAQGRILSSEDRPLDNKQVL
jgi:methyl-accepting chemotaxis protein